MNIDFKLPELGENVESGDVVNVLVKEGDRIEANQGVVELETEKAVVEIPCPHAGKVVKLHVKKGDRSRWGRRFSTVEAEEAGARDQGSGVEGLRPQSRGVSPRRLSPPAAPPFIPRPPAAHPSPRTPSPPRHSAPPLIPAGPGGAAFGPGVGRRLAAGPGHRRPRPDHAGGREGRGVPAARRRSPVEAVVPPGEPGSDAWGPVRRERMSQIRRTIAAQMARSASTIPHVTNFDDADITDLEHLRKGVPPGYLGPEPQAHHRCPW